MMQLVQDVGVNQGVGTAPKLMNTSAHQGVGVVPKMMNTGTSQGLESGQKLMDHCASQGVGAAPKLMDTGVHQGMESGPKLIPGSVVGMASQYFKTEGQGNSPDAYGPGVVDIKPVNDTAKPAQHESAANFAHSTPGVVPSKSITPARSDEAAPGDNKAIKLGPQLDEYNAYIRSLSSTAQQIKGETRANELLCLHCGKVFESMKVLKRHLTTHSEVRPHTCDQCDRSFTDTNKLKRHKITHTGVKPYQCTICDQRLSRPEHLRRHLWTHVDEKPYKCSACDYCGKRPERVRAHQRKAHMEVQEGEGGAGLTVIHLDVKLPEGIAYTPTAQAAQAADNMVLTSVEELQGLEHKVKKERKRKNKPVALPPMREPNSPLPPMRQPNSLQYILPKPYNISPEHPPSDTKSFPPSSGPVFPGQISPRVKQAQQGDSDSNNIKPMFVLDMNDGTPNNRKDRDTPAEKQSQTVTNNDNSKLTINGVFLNKAYTQGFNKDRFSNTQPQSGPPPHGEYPSVKMESQPNTPTVKMERDSPVTSFAGFGSTNFSSIGIPSGTFAHDPTSGVARANHVMEAVGGARSLASSLPPVTGSHVVSHVTGHMSPYFPGHVTGAPGGGVFPNYYRNPTNYN